MMLRNKSLATLIISSCLINTGLSAQEHSGASEVEEEIIILEDESGSAQEEIILVDEEPASGDEIIIMEEAVSKEEMIVIDEPAADEEMIQLEETTSDSEIILDSGDEMAEMSQDAGDSGS